MLGPSMLYGGGPLTVAVSVAALRTPSLRRLALLTLLVGLATCIGAGAVSAGYIDLAGDGT